MNATQARPTSDSDGQYSSPSKGRLLRWVMLLIALPSAVQAASYMRFLIRLLGVHNEAGYPEGVCVFGFMTAFHTHRLYLPPFDFPWNAQLFGPLFVMTGAFVANVFHGAATPITVFMRTLSLVSLLGSLALIGYAGWKLEGRKTWVVITVILALACTWLIPYSASARPDTFAIVLCLASAALYVASEGNTRLIYIAGIVGAASFLTKQSTAPVLMALMIDLLWSRKIKEAFVFVAGGITTALPILLTIWLRHEPFIANFTAISHVTQDWKSIPSVVFDAFRVNQVTAIGISLALLGAAFKLRDKRYRGILLGVAFAWLSNIAALANVGGGPHYLILPWLLTMLLVPAGLRQVEIRSERAVWIPVAIFLVAAFIVIHQRSLLSTRSPEAIDARPIENLTMLTDLPYLELRSKEPQLIDTFTYNEFAKQGVWKDTPVLERIDAKHYDLLLMDGKDSADQQAFQVNGFRGVSLWSEDLLRESALNYRVLCEVGNGNDNYQRLILVPQSRQVNLSASDVETIFHSPCYATDRRPELAPGMH